MQKKIDKYILQHEIGTGSFGCVYKGKHQDTGQEVAIKAIHRGSLRKEIKQHLEDEIKVLKCMKHINCMKLYDVKKTENNYYLILEYCNEGNLRSHLNRFYNDETQKNFPEYQAVDFFIQIMHALKSLHKNNIMHRDLKLDNILKHEGIIKLGDFGFSKILDRQYAVSYLGSPSHMAPEILEGKAYDCAADIWSLGTVFYEMLYGEPPFKGTRYDMHEKVHKPVKFPRKISPECEDALRRMLDVNPDRRITIDELLKHEIMTYRQDRIRNDLDYAFSIKDKEKQKLQFIRTYIEHLKSVMHASEGQQAEGISNYMIRGMRGDIDFEYQSTIMPFMLPDEEAVKISVPVSKPDVSLGPEVAELSLSEYLLWIRKTNSRKILHERNMSLYLMALVDETMNRIPKTSEFVALCLLKKAEETLQKLNTSLTEKVNTFDAIEWNYYITTNKFKYICQLIVRDHEVAKIYLNIIVDKIIEMEKSNPGMQLYYQMYKPELYKGVLEDYYKELGKMLYGRENPEEDREIWLHAYKILRCRDMEKHFPLNISKPGNVFNFKLFYEKLGYITFNAIVKDVYESKLFYL